MDAVGAVDWRYAGSCGLAPGFSRFLFAAIRIYQGLRLKPQADFQIEHIFIDSDRGEEKIPGVAVRKPESFWCTRCWTAEGDPPG
jgi:hypothetical protein